MNKPLKTALKSARIYVLDTSVILHSPASLTAFKEQTVCVPLTVLEELDNLKDRSAKSVSLDARHAIRMIDDLLQDAEPEDIQTGVPIPAFDSDGNQGHLVIIADAYLQMDKGIVTGVYNDADNRIINTCLYLKKHYRKAQVVLVSKDINMRIKGKTFGLQVEDFRRDRELNDIDLLYTGVRHFSGSLWDHIDANVATFAAPEGQTGYTIGRQALADVLVNQYLYDDEDFVARVTAVTDEAVKLITLPRGFSHRSMWGIRPRNLLQAIAMHQLLSEQHDLHILLGSAGTGKTLLAVAAALELIIEQGRYSKLIVARTNDQLDKDIGFLPGTEEEKVSYLLGGIVDSLEFLHEQDEHSAFSVDYIRQKANIEFRSVNYMRGRSISNAVIIYDEIQNATIHQVRGLLSRAGENTKVICLGNLRQIDNHFLTPLSSGLTAMVEKFKYYSGCTVLQLQGVVRSPLADYTENHF